MMIVSMRFGGQVDNTVVNIEDGNQVVNSEESIKATPMSSGSSPSARPARQLVAEVVGLSFDLTAVAARLHGDGDVSAGRRAILANLRDFGYRTVPDLAALRPVSRQYVQKVMDGLAADGLVSSAPNPRHRRSPYYELTTLGRRRLEEMDAREEPLFDRLEAALGAEEFDAALDILRRLRSLVREVPS